MKPTCGRDALRRLVNLTLKEDLANRATAVAESLSGVVGSRLADHVANKQGEALPMLRRAVPRIMDNK